MAAEPTDIPRGIAFDAEFLRQRAFKETLSVPVDDESLEPMREALRVYAPLRRSDTGH